MKKKYAKLLGLDRTSLYRTSLRQAERDIEDIIKIRKAHKKEPYYGVDRLATMLNWSINKTRRIRDLAGVSAKRKKKRSSGKRPEIASPPNLTEKFWRYKIPDHPEKGYTFMDLAKQKIWVEDFTYLNYHGTYYYLAVVLSLTTREVVGYSFSHKHDKELVCDALKDALKHFDSPDYLHSDCGAEYLSLKHLNLCKRHGIKHSASKPGNPWQNGFMERFFRSLKSETELNLAKSPKDLERAVKLYIEYYNTTRIHTSLKMPPIKYRQKLLESGWHNVLQKKGG